MKPDFPIYALVGDLPVRAFETEGGGVDVEAWDPQSRTMVRALKYLPQLLFERDEDGHVEVTPMSEKDWRAHVTRLEKQNA